MSPSTLHRDRLSTFTNYDFIILASALLVRLIHLWFIYDNPFFTAPILDAEILDQKAWDLAQGAGLGNKAFFQPPLYIYSLASLYKIFGHNYLIPRLVQVLLGSLTAWFVFRLAGRIYNRKVALVAGLIIAFYGPLVHYSGQLLITTVFVFLVTLCLLLIDRLTENPTPLSFFIVGITFGLAALARPNILIFSPFILLWIVFSLKDRGKEIGLLFLGTVLIILPVTLRNYIVEKDFVLISAQAGVNFYMGNNPISSGRSAWVAGTSKDWWGEGYYQTIEMAEKAAGKPLKSSEVSSYWFGRTFHDQSEWGGRWFPICMNKLRYLFAGYELSDNEDIYFQRRYSPILAGLMWFHWIAFPFGLLLPLAIFGLIFTFTWKRQAHLFLFQLSFASGLLLFFINCRFKLPLVPLMAIWAAAGIVHIFALFKEKQAARYSLAFVGLLILLVIVNRHPVKGEIIPLLDGTLNLGSRYLEDKNYTEALELFEEASLLDSTSSRAHNGAGMALMSLSRYPEAREKFEQTIKCDPAQIQARNNLAMILQQEGDIADAKLHFYYVIQMDSSNVFANRGFADIALGEQEWERAEKHYQSAHSFGADDRQLMSRWAQSLLAQEKYTDALHVNSLLLIREPNNPRIHFNQARIYIYCDSLEQARDELEIVLQLDPQNEEARRELEEMSR